MSLMRDLESMETGELLELYSSIVDEMRGRDIVRGRNIVSELGKHFVIEKYDENPDCPNLYLAPAEQQYVDAVGFKTGERYCIRTITSSTTGAIRLEGTRDNPSGDPVFDYLVICKLSDCCRLEGIYQIDWDTFFGMKKWHKGLNAWYVSLTGELRSRSEIVYESKK